VLIVVLLGLILIGGYFLSNDKGFLIVVLSQGLLGLYFVCVGVFDFISSKLAVLKYKSIKITLDYKLGIQALSVLIFIIVLWLQLFFKIETNPGGIGSGFINFLVRSLLPVLI